MSRGLTLSQIHKETEALQGAAAGDGGLHTFMIEIRNEGVARNSGAAREGSLQIPAQTKPNPTGGLGLKSVLVLVGLVAARHC